MHTARAIPAPAPAPPTSAGRAPDYRAMLMAHARDAGTPTAMAVAGTVSVSCDRHGVAVLPIVGLDAARTRAMLARWFPGADRALGLDWAVLAQAGVGQPSGRFDETADLIALFLDHRDATAGAEESGWAAHVLANGCLGGDHLWQDMRFPSRRELSSFIARWFPSLAEKNTQDMKWKKFFYKQLCERAEIFLCKAPSCAVCVDRPLCFESGPV